RADFLVRIYDLSYQRRTRMHHIPPNLSASRRRSSRTRAPLAAKATKIASVQISFPHPLSWGRSRCADEFKDIDVNIARHYLSRSAIIGEPHWFLGAAGDAAVAIGVALRVQRQRGETLVSLDLAMPAVLCVAIEGDPTTRFLLSAILKARSDVDPPCSMLSDTWLTEKPRSQRN